MSLVVCRLPKAGLGNQLFPLVKAAVFARLNELPLSVVGYHQFKIGPYLRREKTKRNYSGYFSFQRGWLGESVQRMKLATYGNYRTVCEPPVEALSGEAKRNTKFQFSDIPHYKDYFAGLREHRELALTCFREMLNGQVAARVDELEAPPCIGVHIRMGDFRKLRAGEDFGSVGAVRTPEDYFADLIEKIRTINGRDLPVSVFTDGYKHEFQRLFDMQGVSMVEGNADIVDMLLLSRSKLIITSAGSTFSYWSAFLSNAPVIMHPDHLHAPVRPDEVNRHWYEGPFDPAGPDETLMRNIKRL